MQLLRTLFSIHKTIIVRPTKYFFLLLGVIISLFLQAYMHNYNIVYIMMFFITALAGTSTIFGMFNLHPLSLSLLSYERFFANTLTSYKLLLHNSATYKCYDITLHKDTKQTHIPLIKEMQNITIHMQEKFTKRGKAELTTYKFTSFFPFAHEIKTKNISLNKSIIIYPKPYGISIFEHFAQDLATHGDISDFDTIKPYIQGENISFIHWASLAKNNTLMSKKFFYEQKKETLVFDIATLKGEDEDKLSQLTLWVLECEQNQLSFILRLKNKNLNSKRDSIDAILTQLALY